jgi:hypothetical protein
MARAKKETEESSGSSQMDKKKSTKKDKDPNAPKRARSAYIIFSGEEGKKIRKAHPEMSAPDVMREIGRRWGTLDASDKVRYEEDAAADKERYSEEMGSYSPPPTSAGEGKIKRAKKDPNAPKRSQSAYLIFSQAECKKIREANPEMSVGDVMKEAAVRWSTLDPNERKPWDAKASTDKNRYDEEMVAYKDSKED